MVENEYLKEHKPVREKAFEFLIVLIVISLLIYIGVSSYEKPIETSQKSIVEFHAGVFSRMVTILNAYGKHLPDPAVPIDGTIFYLNEKGWPANTNKRASPSLRNQTTMECQQLWQGVFSNAPRSEILVEGYKQNVDYLISLNKKVICRYELARKQEGSYFFDYDVRSGEVTVGRPEQ